MSVKPAAGSPGLSHRVAGRVRTLVQPALRQLRYGYQASVYNTSSRRLFQSHHPELSSIQQRIVQDLAARGIAFAEFNELFGDAGRWEALSRLMVGFVNSDFVKSRQEKYVTAEREARRKAYLVTELLGRRCPVIPLDDPALQVGLDGRLLDTVNAYLQLWSKLVYRDLWYTIPQGPGSPATASQQWHRDHEDVKMVKVFLYFSEVDETAGPLQYIPGSRRSGGPYSHLWRNLLYPPQQALEERIPRSEWVTGTGGPGTLVFCDTSGFHRGGSALSRPRLSMAWAYVTPACVAPRQFTAGRGHGWNELPAAARFAAS